MKVVQNPQLYLNEYLQNTLELSADLKEHEMYAVAKKRFHDLIPKNKIEKIVDQKYRNHSKDRKINPAKKKSILERSISKLKKELVAKQEELNNVMNEPFYMMEKKNV